MRKFFLLLPLVLLAACGGETEPATNVGSTTATGNAIAGCKADLSGSYVWQTKAASGNWTDQGGPVAFDCPPDQDPNTAGYQWGRSDVPITQQFTGLTPSTTYQFRLEATLENGSKIHNDSVGATNGENYDSFTTTAAAGNQANPATTGTPAGWTPATTRSTPLTVTTPGAVVQDMRLTNGADILVRAANVTLRRVELQGGLIDNQVGGCNAPGLLIEDSSLVGPDHATPTFQEGAVGYGGYTARGVEITGRSEGFRVSNCGPVTIERSFAKIDAPGPNGQCPDHPGTNDNNGWHGDGIQGYGGDGLTVRNVTISMLDTNGGVCFGTSPFFYDGTVQNGNVGPLVVDGLLVEGQGIPARLGNDGNNVSGSVKGLMVVDGSWIFQPVTANCSLMVPWEAKIVTRDANYQTTAVRNQPCM